MKCNCERVLYKYKFCFFLPQALLYFIHVMDHIAVKEYVLVYFHTLTNDYNQLDSNFLKKLYDVVDAK